MKTKLFLLSAVAMVALTGCKRDRNSQEDSEGGLPAMMEINFIGDQIGGKAVGIPNEVTEATINKGVVLVFRGSDADPSLDSRTNFDFTGSNPSLVRASITRGIRQVYVVANVNPADFAGVYKLSDLQHLSNKLTLSAFRNSGSLPMSGFVQNVDASGSTTQNPLKVTVQLGFIGSRVHVDWDDSQLPVGATVTGAVLLNVPAKSEYIATPNGSGGYNPLTYGILDYLQGIGNVSMFTGAHLPSAAGVSGTSNNHDTELFILTQNKGFDQNYTYVFENGSPKPMIIAIQGTYNANTVYWPIVINGAFNGSGGSNTGDGSATVKHGMIYKVKAILKANVGYEDPYSPVNPGAIDVEILPASWLATIRIDQEF